MRKTIMQLEQFMFSIQQQHHSRTKEEEEESNEDDDDDDDDTSWAVFCREGDTENLLPLSSIVQKEKMMKDDDNDDGDGDGENPISSSNSNNGTFISETKTKATTTTTTKTAVEEPATKTKTSESQASQLGQYFCSKENATIVVNWIINKILSTTTTNNNNILFVEPSCGHGDIVFRLVEEEEVNKIEEAVVTETSKASICPFRLIFGRTCSVIHLVGHSKPNDSRTV